MNVLNQEINGRFAIYNADCIDVLSELPDESIHYTLFSPPFASLFTYSNSDRDLGNTKNDDGFAQHFEYLVPNLYRVTKPGRLLSFHCMDIPAMKERDGYIGLKDFPGDLIRVFQKHGWIYHSRHTIWKDPLIEATRTKALGLMHKQLIKDSAICRAGLPDYLITMRKLGENKEPIHHQYGLYDYVGEDTITETPSEDQATNKRSHLIWRKYASPVWMDINQTNTLQKDSAREEKDERHICPLQLDVIERALELWSNPNDTILSPFAGIGSEGYVALKKGRKFIGIELKESYYKQAVLNCKTASQLSHTPSLFDDEWE